MKVVVDVKGNPKKNDVIVFDGKNFVFINKNHICLDNDIKIKNLTEYIEELKQIIQQQREEIKKFAIILKEYQK